MKNLLFYYPLSLYLLGQKKVPLKSTLTSSAQRQKGPTVITFRNVAGGGNVLLGLWRSLWGCQDFRKFRQKDFPCGNWMVTLPYIQIRQYGRRYFRFPRLGRSTGVSITDRGNYLYFYGLTRPARE
jgi:hypothetical protein